jgi:isoleucyl-tRNA synthetase
MVENKDYSKTLNLPKTDFQMKADLTKREPILVEQWQKKNLYLKICKKNSNKKKFIFHDGPPYANAHIHIGTALNKVLKDFVVKHSSMSGNYTPFTPGWDCHGLPIEQIVLKNMNVDKNKIDKLVFRKQAANFAKKFIEIQKNEFKRLGIIANWDHPYLTLDPKYEAFIVKVFGQLVKMGFIYRKKKPVYWCPTCETALADAEVEHLDHSTDSIFVKFDIISLPKILKVNRDVLKDFSVLIWTTTPWTLPANVALAFDKKAKYSAVIYKFKDLREEKLIIAKVLVESIKNKIKAESFKFVFEAKGIDFINLMCRNPLFDENKLSRGIVADFVSIKDGTGIVHIATGHGFEDYQVGLEYNLEIFSPVDSKGLYTKEIPEFENIYIFDANPLIIDKLVKEQKILAKLKLDHSYPYCWRCKKPIIFRATLQWFLSIEHNCLRKKLLASIKDINWIPNYGQTRITSMIKNRPDWCLSRQRLWGVPIPIFYCKKCLEPLIDFKIIDKISKLFEEEGSNLWFEMSEKKLLEGTDAKCSSCGSTSFNKEQDILDVWFDSGISYEAVLSSGNYEDLKFPADLYLEGNDQHRGWFQTSIIPSVAIKGVSPCKSILTHGFVVDGYGKKMSKSLGNVISSEYLINKYGADVVRLWIALSDYKEDIKISDEIIRGLVDSYRKIRNTIRFLLGNLWDFNLGKIVFFEDMKDINKYALSELQHLISSTTVAYKNYEFHKAIIAISNFCTIFLSGFYFDALKDILYCDRRDSRERISIQTVMFEICFVMIRLLAPVLSFTAEEAWVEIKKLKIDLPESIFLSDFPTVNADNVINDIEVIKKWEKITEVRKKVFLVYERLRQDKIVGSNLEISLYIQYGKKYIDVFKDLNLIHLVFGSWDVNCKLSNEKDELLIIDATKSKYDKCSRCWRYIHDIKNGLCLRCREVVE